MHKHVVMLAPVNFLRSYAGLQYIADYLHYRGVEVEVFAHVPMSMAAEAKSLPYRVHSCYEGTIGKIPRLRHLSFRLRIARSLRRCDGLIVTSTNARGYIARALAFKRRYPQKAAIQYCPELWNPTNGSRRWAHRGTNGKRSELNLLDMVIDVEPHRADLRRELFELDGPIHVLANTLPAEGIPEAGPSGILAELAGVSIPRDCKVLLFTGVASPKSVSEMAPVMRALPAGVFFLWFAHGSVGAIHDTRTSLGSALENKNWHVCPAVPRRQLLRALHEADAGLIAYSYRECPTLNQKYAAPTKLYEYIACGLPIVSYGNPSIRTLVEDHGLGECALEDSPAALAEAAVRLFKRHDFEAMRERVKQLFHSRFCYEVQNADVIDRLYKLVTE